jgi:anti-sigma-K factor RskA
MTITTDAPKYSKAFWIDLADRVVSTAAQAGLGLATAAGFDLIHPDLPAIAAIIGTASLVAVLKAFAVERKTAVVNAALATVPAAIVTEVPSSAVTVPTIDNKDRSFTDV